MTKPHRDRPQPGDPRPEDMSKLGPGEAVMRLYWSAMGDKPKLSVTDGWQLLTTVQEALSAKKAEDRKDRYVSAIALVVVLSVIGLVIYGTVRIVG